MKVFYDKDADLARLEGKTVAILGYGSQGHAHALNLRDSGVGVVIGLRPGSGSWSKAEGEGLQVMSTADAAAAGDIVMMTLPDENMADIYQSEIEPNIKVGNYLALAHGFNFHFGCITPPEGVNTFMVAPKGPGHMVRDTYSRGGGVPCLVAVDRDPDELWKAIGAKVRNLVRKAERAGLSARPGDPATDLDAFYDVFARNMRDLGTPVYAAHFFRFRSCLRLPLLRRPPFWRLAMTVSSVHQAPNGLSWLASFQLNC